MRIRVASRNIADANVDIFFIEVFDVYATTGRDPATNDLCLPVDRIHVAILVDPFHY